MVVQRFPNYFKKVLVYVNIIKVILKLMHNSLLIFSPKLPDPLVAFAKVNEELKRLEKGYLLKPVSCLKLVHLL